jgi:hypothetical protein
VLFGTYVQHETPIITQTPPFLVNIMSMPLLFLDVVAQAGDLNARVKGIANYTRAQVPAQLPGRVPSEGSP